MSSTGTEHAGVRTVEGMEVPAPGTWRIDPSHTAVGFVARHLGLTKVRGRFVDVSGTVEIAERPEDSTAEVRIATASLDTRDESRDQHLRSADFFDVEQFPEMTFRSTGVRRAADGWKVDGDLTIKGVTRPVTLDVDPEGVAVDPWGNTKAGFSATAELERDAWGLTWNVALEAGGLLVGKKVQLQLDVQLVRQDGDQADR